MIMKVTLATEISDNPLHKILESIPARSADLTPAPVMHYFLIRHSRNQTGLLKFFLTDTISESAFCEGEVSPIAFWRKDSWIVCFLEGHKR